jgi:rhodanese-related sulfurtransferase
MLQFVLSNCQKKAAMPCQIVSLNNEDYTQKYTRFNQQSAQAIRSMQIRSEDYRLVEAQNWWIEPPEQLRTLNEGVHFPTPMHLDGIQTIDTPSLVAAIKADNMLVIDAIGFYEDRTLTLPKAYAFDWIGIEYGSDSQEHRIDEIAQENLSIIMNHIAPDKTQAIAVYCSSPECWLGVNAALRLKALGYINVHWYRGGIEAWLRAGLPTVKFVPFATIWGRP